MENQTALLIQKLKLINLSETSLVLNEQDKSQTITLISYLLQRLSSLYQLPNWTEQNAVLLAGWIFDNYKFDSLDDVIACLKNPPHTENKQWRLTPDTIKEWMEIVLEKRAEQREQELSKLKDGFKGPLPGIDYEAFKKRMVENRTPQEHHAEAFKAKYQARKREEWITNLMTEERVNRAEAEKIYEELNG